MNELPEEASETKKVFDDQVLDGAIATLPVEHLLAFLSALDHTAHLPDERGCFEVEEVIAEVDAELAARTREPDGRDGA